MLKQPVHARIDLDAVAMERFCLRHPIQRLSLFGSVLGDGFGPDSDVDFLVEFQQGARVTLFDVGGMMHELSELIGRQADVRTPSDLSPYFRRQVLRDAELTYEAG